MVTKEGWYSLSTQFKGYFAIQLFAAWGGAETMQAIKTKLFEDHYEDT